MWPGRSLFLKYVASFAYPFLFFIGDIYTPDFLSNIWQVFPDNILVFSLSTHLIYKTTEGKTNCSLFQLVIFFNMIGCCVKNTRISHTHLLNFLKCFFSLYIFEFFLLLWCGFVFSAWILFLVVSSRFFLLSWCCFISLSWIRFLFVSSSLSLLCWCCFAFSALIFFFVVSSKFFLLSWCCFVSLSWILFLIVS